jgi:hypothetical protein
MCHHKLENLLAIPPFTSWSLVKSVLVLQNLVPIGDVKTTDNKLHYKKKFAKRYNFFFGSGSILEEIGQVTPRVGALLTIIYF